MASFASSKCFNCQYFLFRLFVLLNECLDDENIAGNVLETSPDLLAKLLTFARSVDPGERQVVVESHCEELRALFKEYVRPINHDLSPEKRRSDAPCEFDIMREFPIPFGCVFMRDLTSVHYVCDPGDNPSCRHPRGALIFADKTIPTRVSILESNGVVRL